ncbi:hypothetical protein KBX53_21880 [Micromonospora sp. M51]|uniref:hypothetical protein n=1 Tax=Micromonospora sp. M51 TaxID=2824889 RepID=UPI001B36570F|nr:hypothetical protein [Micromonospora sp. M51]MBQ1013546.1 hypothetical protein [Micromonospora sp. M51]
MTYYVIYRNDERVGGPAGLFVMDVGAGSAILWDHRSGRWAFDPALVVRFVNDYRNMDRFETVDRATAERVAETVSGGRALPDEDDIRAMFATDPSAGGPQPSGRQ